MILAYKLIPKLDLFLKLIPKIFFLSKMIPNFFFFFYQNHNKKVNFIKQEKFQPIINRDIIYFYYLLFQFSYFIFCFLFSFRLSFSPKNFCTTIVAPFSHGSCSKPWEQSCLETSCTISISSSFCIASFAAFLAFNYSICHNHIYQKKCVAEKAHCYMQ